jgi:hypothetical protein
MTIFEFYRHGGASLYGTGDANQAAQLTHSMNRHRACDPWNFRQVEQADGPRLNIADELAWHRATRLS